MSAVVGTRVVVADSAEEAGRRAADHVLEILGAGRALLGVATGSSPQPLYRAMTACVREGRSLHRLRAFALDEYVGIPREHPESYHSIVARDVTVPLGLDPTRVHVPDGQAADPDAAAVAYEAAVAAVGGVEVQVLGIGGNGHIGFNEPGSSRASRTRVIDLKQATRIANARFFGSVHDVPTRAITQGVATIMSAAHLVVVADGPAKAEAVARALRGPVGPEAPASFLQEHADTVYFLDRAAARLLD